MENLLYETIDYKIETTPLGTWKSFLGINGMLYREFTSHSHCWGLPLIHYTYGRDPATGRRKLARGIFAVGRIAFGIFPVGQLAIGVMPVGQLSLGLLFGLGQVSTGFIAIGQVAIGLLAGVGQLAFGLVSIGQFAAGFYCLGQLALGVHEWTVRHCDPMAKRFFLKLLRL